MNTQFKLRIKRLIDYKVILKYYSFRYNCHKIEGSSKFVRVDSSKRFRKQIFESQNRQPIRSLTSTRTIEEQRKGVTKVKIRPPTRLSSRQFAVFSLQLS
jgi:hypothetical protein